MTTLLVLVWILLTCIIIGLPARYFFRWLLSTTRTVTMNLQDQIKSAKEVLATEPLLPEEDITLIEEIVIEELPQATPSYEEKIPEAVNTIQEESAAEDSVEESEEPGLEPELSAEKLAQMLDDIKYAALTNKERGKKDEYEKKLIEGLALMGNNEEFLGMLADHYFEEQMFVKAGTLLKKLIQVNPVNHKAIWQLGNIYLKEKDLPTAKLLLEKALELKDDNPKYLISLVEIYYEEGNLKDTIPLVEKLSRLRPTNTDYLLTLAKLYEELNQPTKAHTYYMKVLEINPLQDEAKKALKRVS